jgi:hypothetical protein
MALIQAQRQRLISLIDENVRLTAAVAQLQQEIATIHEKQHELEMARNGEVVLDPDAREYIKDVTDEVVGAEMDPRAEITT